MNDVAVTMIAKAIDMMAGTLAERMAGRNSSGESEARAKQERSKSEQRAASSEQRAASEVKVKVNQKIMAVDKQR